MDDHAKALKTIVTEEFKRAAAAEPDLVRADADLETAMNGLDHLLVTHPAMVASLMASGADAARAKIRTMIATSFSAIRVRVASAPPAVSNTTMQVLREFVAEHVAAGWCDAIREVYPEGTKRAALVVAAKQRAARIWADAPVEAVQKMNGPADVVRACALDRARNNPDCRQAVLGLDTKLAAN